MKLEDVKHRVTYHPPNEKAVAAHTEVRIAIENAMMTLAETVPDGREQAVVMTKLEEAMFWANAGIARNHEAL